MEKIKLTREYLDREISSAQKNISHFQEQLHRHMGVLSHCQWLLENISFEEPEEDGTHVVEVPLNGKLPGEIVLG